MIRQNNRIEMKSNEMLQVAEEMNVTIDNFKAEIMH